MRERIAVIEDETTIADAVAARLRAEGFDVEVARDGIGGVALCQTFRPDLVVLDLMLPGLDGLEVCRRIQHDRAVLMLTARDSDTDVEIGLAVGADDYLRKPFSPREVVARVRALLRRAGRSAPEGGERIRLGALVIDPATRSVSRDGADVHLTPTEFALLHRLAAETVSLAVGGLLALVFVAGLVPVVRAHFARTALAGAAVGLLAFSLSNPDGRVAARNVERWRATGDLDVAYAQRLSADAVPALEELPEPLHARVLVPYRARLADGGPWSSANRSRHRAREILSRDAYRPTVTTRLTAAFASRVVRPSG